MKIGAVPYANALPLLAGLDGREGVTIDLAAPSRLAPRVASGELDVALLPVAELLRHPSFEIVGDACIAARGPVDSVLLLLRRAPHRLRTLALDPESRTSQLLVRLVLAESHGVAPEAAERDAVEAWESGEVDGVLAIGDKALALRARGLPHLDLAHEWFRLTGLPFVFAAWVGREGLSVRRPEAAGTLAAARDRGLAKMGALAVEAGGRTGLPADVLRVYLERRIRYRLAAPEREGLALFLDMARSLVEA